VANAGAHRLAIGPEGRVGRLAGDEAAGVSA
jgi:hypothetical protein